MGQSQSPPELRPIARGAVAPPTTSRRGRTILPFAPQPLQTRLIRREVAVPGSPVVTGIYRIWDVADGRRCRLCPEGTCNLADVPGRDTASCLIVVEGEPELAGAPVAATYRG